MSMLLKVYEYLKKDGTSLMLFKAQSVAKKTIMSPKSADFFFSITHTFR